MYDVTTFLVRWLFLSNLVRNTAEVQTLPYQPFTPSPPSHPSTATTSHPNQTPRQHEGLLWHDEEVWRDQCIRGILACPPGHQRSLAMDAVRVQLVQQLSELLQSAGQVLSKEKNRRRRPAKTIAPVAPLPDADANESIIPLIGEKENVDTSNREVKSGEAPAETEKSSTTENQRILPQATTESLPVGSLVKVDTTPSDEDPSPEQVQQAAATFRDMRECLPQLVSAVLKSPPAFDPYQTATNPIDKLRNLMIERCEKDPSWGIELCWMLEAEVGRTWKSLFEHRQKTGRRLILVMPAEKAAVLAKIGSEKRDAFDLLQAAEHATAYGRPWDPRIDLPPSSQEEWQHQHQQHSTTAPSIPAPPLTSSVVPQVNLRRCGHFGDTMHLIDRLTQISLDLKQVPTAHREAYLHDRLHETNRRIRRRMATRGDVSLDVEDNRSPYDWPQLQDLTLDMLKYSVHFPLVPQTGTWPTGNEKIRLDGEQQPGASIPEVVRVLNIVVDDSRILSSRERCPYLIHLEVADTGLEGSDKRLYDVDNSVPVPARGSAVPTGAVSSSSKTESPQPHAASWQSFDIENQLPPGSMVTQKAAVAVEMHRRHERTFPRGGWQSDEPFYQYQDGGVYANPYDAMREHEYATLHEQMQQMQQPEQVVPHGPYYDYGQQEPTVSTGLELLNEVFGSPWNERCQTIRESSPYGTVDGWRLASFIMKAGEDIRREAFVMQVITKLRTWFHEDIPSAQRPYLRPYTIMCVGGDAGLLECLSDAKSIDEVKKRTDEFTSLRDFFERAFGPPRPRNSEQPVGDGSNASGVSFETAQENFLRSLVGYSLVCYILQIKDRHNANILLDREGHVVHIDFGFVLGDTPKMGKVPIFSERAPFKLSAEFWDVLGGWNINSGGLGVRFCKMFELAFASASKHAEEIATLVESAALTLNNSPRAARLMANGVRSRLRMRGAPGSVDQKMFVMNLVNAALTSWGTTTYDWLQRNMNGYQ